jgi:hypothetical protein
VDDAVPCLADGDVTDFLKMFCLAWQIVSLLASCLASDGSLDGFSDRLLLGFEDEFFDYSADGPLFGFEDSSLMAL